ncbi:hypothetical protein [Argonema antarcticum]|uniref:hypothetical protein n=1 Tax=Argonema antarcticum TaxID=2942763 RepID=UPI002011AEA4|nr:hypothetical protein [Argonema antarcticum]MCL1475160.1 hypothetical protein [Argonema antarcticum A004/B2]
MNKSIATPKEPDASLTINKIESGSIKILFEGSEDGFREIESLFQSGELTEVLGIPILAVREIGVTSSENTVNLLDLQVVPNNDPIAVGIAFLESDDLVAVRVREKLKNRAISEIVAQLNAAYPELSPNVVVDILVGNVATGETKRDSDDIADTIELLELAIKLAKKLAEIWGEAE